MSSTETTWTTDTNTKSGIVQVYEQSVSTLRITAGEATSAILELFSDDGDDNADKWRMWVDSSDNDLHFASYTTGSWGNLLTIQDGGNVGIATDSPASKLHINGTMQVGVDDTGHDVKFFGATSGSYMLWDESQDDLIIGGAGRVGIGTAIPPQQLSVHSSTGGIIALNREDTDTQNNEVLGKFMFGSDDPSDGTFNTGASIEAQAAGTWGVDNGGNDYGAKLIFSTTADGSNSLIERMRIADTGDVGIGTSSPSTRLTVAEATNNENVEIKLTGLSANGSSRSGILGYCPDDNTAANNYLYLTGSGNPAFVVTHEDEVGIGTSNPSYSLEVAKSGNDCVISSSSFSDGSIEHGGTLVLRSSWNDTIGTLATTPDNKVLGDILAYGVNYADPVAYSAAAGIRFRQEGSLSSGDAYIPTDIGFMTCNAPDGGGLGTRMLITAVGNVGIGDTSPTARLDVYGGGDLGTKTLRVSQAELTGSNHDAGNHVTVGGHFSYFRAATKSGETKIRFYVRGGDYNTALFSICEVSAVANSFFIHAQFHTGTLTVSKLNNGASSGIGTATSFSGTDDGDSYFEITGLTASRSYAVTQLGGDMWVSAVNGAS